MKRTTVSNPGYKILEKGFKNWLKLLNYEPGTIEYAPRKARAFFCWLENQGITSPSRITNRLVSDYFNFLKTRRNKKTHKLLSRNYLLTHVTALRKLARYLRESNRESFQVDMIFFQRTKASTIVFTQKEIKCMYKACDNSPLGIRDRAMLAVYYGCGLRRSEGTSLNIQDIFFDKNLLYVKKGKNYKERYVPIAGSVRKDLHDYIYFARPVLLSENTGIYLTGSSHLFITYSGKPLSGNGISYRFFVLKKKAEINKKGGLHLLRHSIATHLLQSGMPLEKIQGFLGHSSLESTQIYTHLSAEQEDLSDMPFGRQVYLPKFNQVK